MLFVISFQMCRKQLAGLECNLRFELECNRSILTFCNHFEISRAITRVVLRHNRYRLLMKAAAVTNNHKLLVKITASNYSWYFIKPLEIKHKYMQVCR